MEITTEWYEAKILHLCKLNNVEDKKDVLTDIKIKFSALNNQDADEIVSFLDFTPLFSELTSNDREFVEQICDILTMWFNVMDLGAVCNFGVSSLITNPNVSVRLFILREFLRIALHPQKIRHLLDDITLIIPIINRISDNDLNVAECAMSIVKLIGKSPRGPRILYKGEPLRTFARLLQNDTINFRVYEVTVDIAKTSREALEISAQSGFLNSLINILENEDILLQLNALEILTQLAVFEEGLSYLEQQEVLSKLVQKISQVNDPSSNPLLNPLSNLLIPGLMKFFGNVARHWPNELFARYPVVISALFDVIDGGDQNILGPALDTLGYVSASIKGKYALQALGEAMPSTLKKIAEIVQRMPTALRIRGLNNLALILEVKRVEQDNRILSLTKLWFDSLCDDPLRMIVVICRQPFADIRQAGLEVLVVISSQVWGQEYISTYPGLVEFLLDRNIELFKECKDAKYEIVKCLSQAERNIFDADTMQKFKRFVNKGPYFVDVNTEVAIEGAL